MIEGVLTDDTFARKFHRHQTHVIHMDRPSADFVDGRGEDDLGGVDRQRNVRHSNLGALVDPAEQIDAGPRIHPGLHPTTLACMHGSAWKGDGWRLLLDLSRSLATTPMARVA